MNHEFIDALRALEKEKGIKKDVMIEAIEQALVTAYKKDYGSETDVRVTINRDTGRMQVFRRWKVVETVENPQTEISLEEAKKVRTGFGVGDVVERDVTPKTFGRIAAQTAKQMVVQKIREEERSSIYDQYSDSTDETVNAIVKRVEKNGVYLDIGKTDAFLPQQEIIPGERLMPGEYVKVYVVTVNRSTQGPQIHVSRTHPNLVKRLFENEVPEIRNGIVQIHSIAREAGFRTKMAVSSLQDDIDPVGACVGQRGGRVERIVDELRGEKIDIIRWSENPGQYIASALSPARVVGVWTDESNGQKAARVVVPDDQLSLAIGREGQNARLAAKLTGWGIDIKSQSEMEKIMAEENYDEDEEYDDEYEDDLEMSEIDQIDL